MNRIAPQSAANEAGRPDLLAEVEGLRRWLAEPGAGPLPDDGPRCRELDRLAEIFGLTGYERSLLLLAASLELDPGLAASPVAAWPAGSVGWALSLDPGAEWAAWHPSSPLVRWHLLEGIGSGGLRPDSRFRIDLPVFYRLLGLAPSDPWLDGLRRPPGRPAALTPRQEAVAESVREVLLGAAQGTACVALTGVETATAREVARAALDGVELGASLVDGEAIPDAPAERDKATRLLERELLLDRRVPIFLAGEAPSPGLAAMVDGFEGPVLVAGDLSAADLDRDLVTFDIPAPDAAERSALWAAALGERDGDPEPLAGAEAQAVGRLAYHFPLGNRAIAHIAAASRGATRAARVAACWREARLRTRPSGPLLQRVDCRADWDDLVLPAGQVAVLRAIVAQVRRRATVYEDWGFARKTARGLAVTALFTGASGVGKTLGAEVVARDLELDLFRVDLAQVADKYVGETEKHLDAVFTRAAEGGAILFFDEADALFSQRGEVKGGQDRYANMTVGYLLQRMETYPGLAILCTNLKGLLDEAFLRRIRFAVHFPFPGQTERLALWRKAFPPEAPVNGLDWPALARLSLNGGDIRTIALNAAFLAAESEGPITMAHIARATEIEAGKTDRQVEAAELRRLVARGPGAGKAVAP